MKIWVLKEKNKALHTNNLRRVPYGDFIYAFPQKKMGKRWLWNHFLEDKYEVVGISLQNDVEKNILTFRENGVKLEWLLKDTQSKC